MRKTALKCFLLACLTVGVFGLITVVGGLLEDPLRGSGFVFFGETVSFAWLLAVIIPAAVPASLSGLPLKSSKPAQSTSSQHGVCFFLGYGLS